MTSSEGTPVVQPARGGTRPGLFVKLMVTFFVVLLVMALLTTWLARRATQAEFMLYTTALGERQAELLVPLLADYYRSNGSWEGVDQVLAGSVSGPAGGGMMGPGMGPPGNPMMRSDAMWEMMGLRALVVDVGGRVVADSSGDPAGSVEGRRLAPGELAQGAPITVGDNQVGTALVTTLEQTTGQSERFLQQVNRAILLAVLGAGTLAMLLVGFLTWRLTRPLRTLTEAADAIAAGDLDQQVKVPPGDEIGDLALAFNQMAAQLGRAEALRRQLTADIAHELRTPLSVIQGNVEALQDGVFPLTREALAPIHTKTTLLIRLVEDLRQLALAETDALTLELTVLDVVPLVREVVAEFQANASARQITLTLEVPPALPPVVADRQRIVQVLDNLLGNALRHAPAGGVVSVRAGVTGPMARVPAVVEDDMLVLAIHDSGPGIPPADLPNVFERFYRAEKGRGRATDGSGSGLGLAIARSLIRAHGGTIGAANAPEGGAIFWFTLTLAGNQTESE